MGDGFGWRESVNYQPGSQPDWGWVSFAPQWVFDGPLILAGVFFVLGVFLAVGFAVLRGLADKKKIAERSWFWPVGQLRAV